MFLNKLQFRSETHGWNDLFNIKVSPNLIPARKNMLHTHGQCALNLVKEVSASYINSTRRLRQNNYQLYLCLNNSVDDYKKLM
jgi:hypothetical protein